MERTGQGAVWMAGGSAVTASGSCVTGRRGFISRAVRASVSRSSARFHGMTGMAQGQRAVEDAAVDDERELAVKE